MTKDRIGFGVLVALCLALSGCSLQVPGDPHGTLDRVEGGILRVGVTDNPPWVEIDGRATPSGTEPDLVTDFAEQMDAEVDWTVGSEAALLDALERGEIDMVIGGFHDDTPWSDKGALTRPYAESDESSGPAKHVMIVRMGENAFLTALEAHLFEETGS